MIRGKRDSSI